MKRIKTIKELGLVLIVFQTLLGFFVVIYGALYTEVDTEKAADMLEFIRSNNIEYYKKLTNPEDRQYLEEFYKHYEVRGNRKIMVCGLFFIVIAINIAIIMIYLIIAGERKEIPPEEGQEAKEAKEAEETEEEKEKAEETEEEKEEVKEKEGGEEVEEEPKESKESVESDESEEKIDGEVGKVLGAVEQKDGGKEKEAGNGDDQSF